MLGRIAFCSLNKLLNVLNVHVQVRALAVYHLRFLLQQCFVVAQEVAVRTCRYKIMPYIIAYCCVLPDSASVQ